MSDRKTIIIGAGPAGMACAYTLANNGRQCTVIEGNRVVGGLCKTIDFNGYFFDIGGHRFLTKSKEITDLWQEIMGDDLLHVKRLSRIYYRKRYFNYPLTFWNTFWNLGPISAFLCVASYFLARLKQEDDTTFEGWIINRFGRRLYNIFFKTYTEKVWAVACKDISADWASQRLKGLSLRIAIKKALFGLKMKTPKTLTAEFLYPREGPGEFYERLKYRATFLGCKFHLGRTGVSIKHAEGRITSLIVQDKRNGEKTEMAVDDFLFSCMTLPDLIRNLDPLPPNDILKAAENLKFRDFLVVNVILNRERIFPDQWIYVHSPNVKLGRIQNYKNWSPAMVADLNKTSLGLEYFCSEGDEIWDMDDVDLINYALVELEKIGISSRKHYINGFVVRYPNAYPIYSIGYKMHVDIIRNYLTRFSNLQTIGRSGLFRYDNSDHALLTGIYAANNFLGKSSHDIWKINTGDEYLES